MRLNIDNAEALASQLRQLVGTTGYLASSHSVEYYDWNDPMPGTNGTRASVKIRQVTNAAELGPMSAFALYVIATRWALWGKPTSLEDLRLQMGSSPSTIRKHMNVLLSRSLITEGERTTAKTWRPTVTGD